MSGITANILHDWLDELKGKKPWYEDAEVIGHIIIFVVVFLLIVLIATIITLIIKKTHDRKEYGYKSSDIPITHTNATLVSLSSYQTSMSVKGAPLSGKAIFEMDNGRRIEFRVRDFNDFGCMVEGDYGVLSYQGNYLLSFVRQTKNIQQPKPKPEKTSQEDASSVNFCPNCGYQFHMPKKYCPKCGWGRE